MSRINELPEAERPREKLARLGAATLSDAELLAIFLRVGVQGMSAIDLGRKLLAEHGSLRSIANSNVEELATLRGLGKAKAAQLMAAIELGKRLSRESIAGASLDNPQAIYDLLAPEMSLLQNESLRVLVLNTKYKLLRCEEISLGSHNESIAHPRNILRPVFALNAHAFALAHNHPSGDPTPSKADLDLTRRLKQLAELLQVDFCDHVIIGHPSENAEAYYSFGENNFI